MSIEITAEYYNKIVDEFLNGLNSEESKIEKEIEKLLLDQIYNDAKKAYKNIINSWYASYSPSVYNRKGTLKKAARITKNNDEVTILMSSDLLGGHRLGNEALYDLTMRKGYHGGALPKKSGISGSYLYRRPVPIYRLWGRSAQKSSAPVSEMRKWAYKYDSTENISKNIENVIRKYLSKYEYFRLFY